MKGLAGGAWWAGVSLVVLLAPLPLGGVNTWWSAPLAAAAIALGLTGVLAAGLSRGAGAVVPPALLPLGIFAFLVLVTMIRLPPGVVGLLSPGRMAVPPLPGGEGGLTLSTYPGGTLEQGLLHLGVFYLVWAVALRPPKAALGILAGAGAAHAALGVFLAEAGGTTARSVLWVYELPDVLTPFGTWVNKNHFAGFLILGAGANLALFLSAWRKATGGARGAGLGERIALATGPGFLRALLPGLGFLLSVLVVFASGSRGAALALAGGLLATIVLAGLARRRLRWWPVLLVLLLLAGAALAARMGSSESVLERLVPSGRYLNRPRLWMDTLRMAADHPVAGTGLGSFPYVIPRYQTFDSSRQFTHAEGDWIQYLAECGVAGALLIGAFGWVLARRLWRALARDDEARALALGAGAAAVGVCLHGFVDSSLHIPANLLAAGVLAGSILGLETRVEGSTAPAWDAAEGGDR